MAVTHTHTDHGVTHTHLKGDKPHAHFEPLHDTQHAAAKNQPGRDYVRNGGVLVEEER